MIFNSQSRTGITMQCTESAKPGVFKWTITRRSPVSAIVMWLIPISMKLRVTVFRAMTVSAALVLLLSSHVGAGETFVDDARGFTLKLPDGFVPNSDFVGASLSVVHAFVLGDPTDDELDIVLFIEDMRDTIGRGRLKPEDLPPGFQGRLFTTQWNGFDVDAFEVPEQLGEIKTITYNVQIPLKPAAIQLKLFGPADRESELKTLLGQILAGLDGESNWIQSAAPSFPVTSSRNYGFVLLAFAIVFILGGLAVLWLVSKKAPKGTVLAIAAGIYVAGLAIGGIRVREIVMLAGALKMLGFTGGILGVVDLLRKPKPRDQEET